MCHELYLSTSSPEDLARYDSEWFHFERPECLDDKITGILLNPRKWYIGSKSGCSCTFRHLGGGDLGFDEPQDWFPEDEDNLKATTELYRVIAALVQGGNEVDCLDVWSGAETAPIATTAVSLSVVSEKAFRLFENHHFVFGR